MDTKYILAAMKELAPGRMVKDLSTSELSTMLQRAQALKDADSERSTRLTRKAKEARK